MLSFFSAKKKRSMKDKTFVSFLNNHSSQYTGMQNFFPIFFISCSLKKCLRHRVMVLALFFQATPCSNRLGAPPPSSSLFLSPTPSIPSSAVAHL